MDIAVIGMAAKLPEAINIEKFYQNLCDARDSIREIPEARKIKNGLVDYASSTHAGYLDDIDAFDHQFFGISPKEAKYMDPHHRLLMEVVYETFENSGYNPAHFSGSDTAVFVSVPPPKYYHLFGPEALSDESIILGNLPGMIAGRISRYFNLLGNSVLIDTTCSSSLVAIYHACNELYAHNAKQALVCSANLDILAAYSGGKSENAVLSSSGKAKAFSADADGTGGGEGVGCILLKPLEDAVKDKDIIYCVIKGVAVNQDAQRSSYLTAPSSLAQKEVIQKAWKRAGVDPSTITYIETHGTGTKLGDPIEVKGLELAFKDFTDAKQFCAISSVKSNIGHTDSMAGLVSFIKAALAVRHGKLFPSLHCSELNPFIDFENTAVYVNNSLKDWPADERTGVRRAGVSSFAMNGTNCHLVIEEYKVPGQDSDNISVDSSSDQEGPFLLTVSAKTKNSLQENLTALKQFISGNRQIPAYRLCYNLNVNKAAYAYRAAVPFENYDELPGAIDKAETGFAGITPDPVFLFSDTTELTDSIIENMRSRYGSFKENYDDCMKDAGQLAGKQAEQLQTFAFQLSLFSLLKEKGIKGKNLLGVGIGELTVQVILKKLDQAQVQNKIRSGEVNEAGNLQEKLSAYIRSNKEIENTLFIEVGNGGSLYNALSILKEGTHKYALASLSADFKKDAFLELISRLYLSGCEIDWSLFHKNEKFDKLALPSYRFEKNRFWVNEPRPPQAPVATKDQHEPVPAEPVKEWNSDWAESEIKMYKIWKEILGVEEMSLDDNFFDLGGHSLNGIKLANRIKQVFETEIEFEDIFEYPTIRALTEYVAARSGPQSILPYEDIELAPQQEYYEISYFQRRMWIMSQFGGASEAYNLNTDLYVLKGDLDVEVFRKVFQEIVVRHESLRTVFLMRDEKLYQRIIPAAEAGYKLDYHDLRQEHDRFEKAKALANANTNVVFDLEKGPMLSVILIRYEDDEYLCQYAMPHIISDGWSEAIILRELYVLYNAFEEKKANPLPVLRIQYKDFNEWQRKQLTDEKLETHRNFWLNRLEGSLPVLELPTYQERPAIQTYNGKYLRFIIPSELRSGMYNFCQEKQVTEYMLFMSVLKLAFYRYTGNTDIILGSALTGRFHKDLENQVGFYVNTVPIRTKFDPAASFSDLLARVKESVLSAFEHRSYPFDLIVEDLQLQRDMSRAPIFDILVDFINYKKNTSPLPSDNGVPSRLSIERLPSDIETTIYDINFEFLESRETLYLNIRFNTDLFTEEQIDRLYRHFEHLASLVIRNPKNALHRYDILLDDEKSLIDRINNTDKAFEKSATVHHYVEKWAQQQPSRPALVFNNITVSYDDLNKRANRLAQYLLKEKALKPGSLAGIMMQRSDSMVEAILAVWKCGASYVPVDINYPVDRVSTILKDSSADLLICSGNADLNGKEELGQLINIVSLKEINKDTGTSDDADPGLAIDTGNLAYIIYTSGSTGKPKGAMVEHVGMMNHIQAKINELGLTADSIVAQNASYCFDISVWQFFAALVSGGTTVIYSDEIIFTPAAFAGQVSADKVTILEVVPSYLTLLLASIKDVQRSVFSSFSHLIVTGEVLPPSLVNNWLKAFPSIPVVNAYGPTEASDDITHYFMREPEKRSVVPVGKPLQNFRIYIVDSYMNICPVGIRGEIVVSGLGVGRGYINDSEKTARVFLRDPFREGDDIRMYRTGDIGRLLSDGLIEFNGRKDNQVKVRGFRIELEEIEKAIIEAPQVSETAVVNKSYDNGEAYLSAYVIVKDGFESSALRSYLESRLPYYMIPSFITVLGQLPLTHNGKIDRKALRNMKDEAESRMSEVVAPATELEHKLHSIWKEVLNAEEVSIEDNFFELGGDSFKAIRVASMFGTGLLVMDIYRYPTIKALAHQISQTNKADLLHQLTSPAGVKKYSIIGIPNSAGDPITYKDVAAEFSILDEECAFYGIAQPRLEPGPNETMQTMLENLAAEVVTEIKTRINTPVILYGQCNGTGLTLELAKRLEDEGIELKAICMGAQLAPLKIQSEVDNKTEEGMLAFLKKMGATIPADAADRAIVFRNWRYDTKLAIVAYNKYINKLGGKSMAKLKTPLYCIVGTLDPLTEGYRKGYKGWNFYAEKINLIVIDEVGHYIARDKPRELAGILNRVAEGNVEGLCTVYDERLSTKVKTWFKMN